MCTNYVAPAEDPGLSELKIDSFRDLYRWTPWKPEIYQDYDAPIVGYVDGQFKPLIAGFGFWPRALQKANVEKAKAAGRKPPIIRSTMNVRDDNLGKSPLYGPAWRAGRRCLIPAKWIYEPNWETGKHIRYRIGLAGWRPLCVAGIWRTLQRPDDWEEWLTTSNIEAARAMLQLYPASDMATEPSSG